MAVNSPNAPGAPPPGVPPAGQQPPGVQDGDVTDPGDAGDQQQQHTPLTYEQGRALRGENATLRRQRTATQQALDAANAELTRIRDAGKSELQRATEAATAATRRAEAAERSVLQLQVARAKGLPDTFASRLQGDTREAMEADADELARALPQQPGQQAQGQQRPRVPNASQHASGVAGGPDPNSWLREKIAGRS